MAKYDQGSAPAVLFNGDSIVWAFTHRALECEFDQGLHDKLIGAGAIRLDAPEEVEAAEKAAAFVEPEGFAGMTKVEVAEEVKRLYGVDVSVNQSRADLMAKVAKIIAAAAGEKVAE